MKKLEISLYNLDLGIILEISPLIKMNNGDFFLIFGNSFKALKIHEMCKNNQL
jgi:hypothetical protein